MANERKVPQQRWQIFPAQKSQAKHIADATALSPLLAQVLINRGIYTPEQAWEFLDPETLLLPSPLDEFPDLVKSLDLLVAAIENQEKILICGDYDADGMTSTALLMRSLRYLGAQVNYAIPSRMAEGYGINKRIVEDFHTVGGRIILTVDNGIAAYEPIAYARELGITVILTDHHDVPETIPPANAILNPKLIQETSPYRGVAGVGVAYILAVCLAQRMDKTQDLTATLLALFTLGTIADLAPLTGVNRRWVKRGLKLLPKSRIPGVQALIEVAGLSEETDMKPEAIGFRLGPRINAVGRIADPQIVIDLLTSDDVGVALQRAMQCEEANKLRRQMCEIIETQAVEWCEAQMEAGLLDLQKERVLVVVQPEWHHGVIGIVASRLVERYGVPVFIGTYEDKGKKEIRGSARSIPEFNVFEALQFCDDLLDKHGGHRAAGGFSFQANKLRQVKSRLSTFACKHLQPEHLKPLVTADVQAQLSEVTLDLYNQIDKIHPCGIENPEPVFWTANAAVVEQKVIGKSSDHLKLTLAQSDSDSGEKTVIKAIAWRWGMYHPLPRDIDIAYKIRLNEWKGRRSVEIELVGVRPAKPIATPDAGIQPWSETLPARFNQPLNQPPSSVSEAVTAPVAAKSLAPNQAAREIARALQQEINGSTVPKSSPTLELPPIHQDAAASIAESVS
ncbi:MAG: single-stranded-DNA-specific exonuclease RecJ, partial [Cyanobacteria bacterium J06554_3]